MKKKFNTLPIWIGVTIALLITCVFLALELRETNKKYDGMTSYAATLDKLYNEQKDIAEECINDFNDLLEHDNTCMEEWGKTIDIAKRCLLMC